MKKFLLMLTVMILSMSVSLSVEAKTYKLRYAHMNSPSAVTGVQAQMLAELVSEKTNGAIKIQVFPSSQLGTLQEMAEQVQSGVVALHHNTMAGIGSLFEPLSALDTPYLYRDVNHLMKVVDTQTSPVMKKLNEQIIKERGVRILYNFYFGTRQLTCDRPIYKPEDLKKVKIRAIPFPIYMTAVEGLGAVATPVDWSEVPTALATGIVNGQENPVDVIYNNKLFDLQSHLMLTGHIIAAECVVINEKVWQSFSPEIQKQIMDAAQEVSRRATQMTLDREAENLANIKKAGMTVIGPEEGLQVDLFRKHTQELVAERFNQKYGELYSEIKAIK